MKQEIRVLGIDDSPFDKWKDKKTLILGVFYRGGNFLDGVLSSYAKVDGSDATMKIACMALKSKFYTQLRAIMLNGIAVGGFNIVDIRKLNKKTGIPVIVVMRKLPKMGEIEAALKKLKMGKKIRLIKSAGEIRKSGKVFIQVAGTSFEEAAEIVKLTATHSFVPEPIRVAHLVASGLAFGESRGKV
ncbi:MAG: DUF99 family protein [Candidatus Woesearchaeota archaeon]